MDIKKIEALVKTPRTNLDDVAKIYSKPMLGFLRKAAVAEWEKSAAVAPVVLASVVQAANQLYERGEDTFGYAVLVFTPDEKKCRDEKWLKDVAAKVAKLRDAEKFASKEEENIANLLNDTESLFDTIELPTSLTGGVSKVFMSCQSIDRVEDVEGGKLHEDSILLGVYVNDNDHDNWLYIAKAALYK